MDASILEALDSQRLQPILSSPFKMPKCRVSKCIYDLVDLAIQTYQGEKIRIEKIGLLLIWPPPKLSFPSSHSLSPFTFLLFPSFSFPPLIFPSLLPFLFFSIPPFGFLYMYIFFLLHIFYFPYFLLLLLFLIISILSFIPYLLFLVLLALLALLNDPTIS